MVGVGAGLGTGRQQNVAQIDVFSRLTQERFQIADGVQIGRLERQDLAELGRSLVLLHLARQGLRELEQGDDLFRRVGVRRWRERVQQRIVRAGRHRLTDQLASFARERTTRVGLEVGRRTRCDLRSPIELLPVEHC